MTSFLREFLKCLCSSCMSGARLVFWVNVMTCSADISIIVSLAVSHECNNDSSLSSMDWVTFWELTLLAEDRSRLMQHCHVACLSKRLQNIVLSFGGELSLLLEDPRTRRLALRPPAFLATVHYFDLRLLLFVLFFIVFARYLSSDGYRSYCVNIALIFGNKNQLIL